MFKNKCFIHKNNAFLKETLKKLGYGEIYADDEVLIATNDGHGFNFFTSTDEKCVKNLGPMFIDCGRSETLFLAIASMTDEHDKFQFFTTLMEQRLVNQGVYWPKGSFEFCMTTDRHFGENPLTDFMIPARKSTIEELMAFFKDKEEDVYYRDIPDTAWKRNENDFDKYQLSDEEKKQLEKLYEEYDKDIAVVVTSSST